MREDVKIICLEISGIMQSVLRGPMRVAKCLKTLGPSLVHVCSFRGAVLLLPCLALGIPIVLTARLVPTQSEWLVYGRVVGSLMAMMNLVFFLVFRRVVLVSSSAARYIDRLKLRYSIIRNAVDTSYYCPCPKVEKDRLRTELHIEPDSRVFITLGGTSRLKGTPEIISAFRQVAEASARLVIVGPGEDRSECEELASGDSRIRFVGNVNDVRPWLLSSDVFISASHTEAMPNALLEAMACGLPVILSRIPAHLEVMIEGGKIGMTFDLHNEQELIACLEDMLKKDLASMSMAARPTIMTHFSVDRMSEQYQQLYYEVAGLTP
jgi:glycosyltransferase involved in cell wall biosynthesis